MQKHAVTIDKNGYVDIGVANKIYVYKLFPSHWIEGADRSNSNSSSVTKTR